MRGIWEIVPRQERWSIIKDILMRLFAEFITDGTHYLTHGLKWPKRKRDFQVFYPAIGRRLWTRLTPECTLVRSEMTPSGRTIKPPLPMPICGGTACLGRRIRTNLLPGMMGPNSARSSWPLGSGARGSAQAPRELHPGNLVSTSPRCIALLLGYRPADSRPQATQNQARL